MVCSISVTFMDMQIIQGITNKPRAFPIWAQLCIRVYTYHTARFNFLKSNIHRLMRQCKVHSGSHYVSTSVRKYTFQFSHSCQAAKNTPGDRVVYREGLNRLLCHRDILRRDAAASQKSSIASTPHTNTHTHACTHTSA